MRATPRPILTHLQRRAACWRPFAPQGCPWYISTTTAPTPIHPDNPLSGDMPDVAPRPCEPVVVKRGSSGFIGTGLKVMLREAGFDHLVIVGGEANMCVESTTRTAGNLGFQTSFVADALVNFQRLRRDGVVVQPRDVLEMSLANMTSFATVVASRALLDELAQAAP